MEVSRNCVARLAKRRASVGQLTNLKVFEEALSRAAA